MGEKKRPVLSISMLVSNNRRDTIEKCMESLVPLREAVPSELIIVDTGCTDGSVEIARRYADRVVQFTWCKDFAAARNAGLSECSGEWFLYLDDDEWFDDVSALIAFFQSKGRDKCDALWYIQRNYDSMEGKSYTDTYVSRCVKMKPGTRFRGKIHEWLEPLPSAIMKTDVFVHHYGYVYKSEEDRQKHLERNLTLEEEAVRENPGDLRMCCQLVQEYRVARRYEDALALCEKCLAGVAETEKGAFVQYLRLAIPKIYKERENYEEALHAFEDLEEKYTLLRQTRLGLYYNKAMNYACMKKEEEVVQTFLRYLRELAAPPVAGEPEFPVMDFAQYESELFRQRAVEYAVNHIICGELYSYADEVYSYMDWDKNIRAKDLLTALFRCYQETGEAALLKQHLPVAVGNPELEPQVYGTLQSFYEKHPEQREKLLADLETLHLECGNFPFFHLLYTEGRQTTTAQDLQLYYEKSDRKYDTEVAALLFTNRALFPQVLEHLSFETYVEAVAFFVTEKDAEGLAKVWQYLPALAECYPEDKNGFWRYAAMVIAEKRLVLYAEQAGTEAESNTQTAARAGDGAGFGNETGTGNAAAFLEDYLFAAKQYAQGLYLPTLLTEAGCTLLPANLRFVCYMEAAKTQEGDFARWGESIKRAAKEYPVLLPVVKVLLAERAKKEAAGRQAENRGQNAADSAKQELLALAVRLKAMVRAQLAEGKTEEARAILSELAVLLPEDAEVKELLGV